MIFLGVKIDDVSLTEALEKARVFLAGGQHKIYTPNPEMLVKARRDKYFRDVLNSGDLNLCDGFGLWLALKCSSGCHSERSEESLNTNSRDPSPPLRMTKKVKRIPGVDFMVELCRLASGQGSSVYFLGSGSNEVAEKTAEEIQKQFPMLKIAGFDKGPVVKECHCEAGGRSNPMGSPRSSPTDESLAMTIEENNFVIEKINQARPGILFVAFGMGKQEKWIHENLAKMPSVKIAMGVGGAFDYISGVVNRAPCWMRKVGLEWAYRLFKEPRRIKRIFNATVLFSLLVAKSKIPMSKPQSNSKPQNQK